MVVSTDVSNSPGEAENGNIAAIRVHCMALGLQVEPNATCDELRLRLRKQRKNKPKINFADVEDTAQLHSTPSKSLIPKVEMESEVKLEQENPIEEECTPPVVSVMTPTCVVLRDEGDEDDATAQLNIKQKANLTFANLKLEMMNPRCEQDVVYTLKVKSSVDSSIVSKKLHVIKAEKDNIRQYNTKENVINDEDDVINCEKDVINEYIRAKEDKKRITLCFKDCIVEELKLGVLYELKIFHKGDETKKECLILHCGKNEFTKSNSNATNSIALKEVNTTTLSFTTPCTTPTRITRIYSTSIKKNLIKLRWDAPNCFGGYKSIQAYSVEMKRDETEEFSQIYNDKKAGCELKDLHSGKSYEIKIRAKNELGYSMYSRVFTFTTKPDVPSKVLNLRVERKTSRCIEVRWDVPIETFGANVDSYKLMALADDGAWTVVSDYIQDSNKPEWGKVSGLEPNSTVSLKVRARTNGGESEWSDVVKCTTDAEVCDEPRKIKAVASGSFVKVIWSPPKNLNGSKVESYEVEQTHKKEPAANKKEPVSYHNTTTCVFENKTLLPGETYAFRVRAKTSVGASVFSESCSVTLTAQRPSQPRNLVVEKCGDCCICVFWDAPEKLNGGVILKYTLKLRKKIKMKNKNTIKQYTIQQNTIQLFDPAIHKVHETTYNIGDKVEALYTDGICYFATIKNTITPGKQKVNSVEQKYQNKKNVVLYQVEFSGYNNIAIIKEEHIKYRLKINDECMAKCKLKGDVLFPAKITALSNEGYFVQYIGQALPIQLTPPSDIERNERLPLNTIQYNTIQDDVREDNTIIEGDVVMYEGLEKKYKLNSKQYNTLSPGEEYYFKVEVTTNAGSNTSELALFKQTGSICSPPPIPKLTDLSKKSISIQYESPIELNGGVCDVWRVLYCPVVEINVVDTVQQQGESKMVYKPVEEMKLSKVEKVGTCIVLSELINGVQYVICSQVHNQYGWSERSQYNKFTTLPSTPDIPVELNLKTEKNTTLKISFKEPALNGGMEITGFVVDVNIRPYKRNIIQQKSRKRANSNRSTGSNHSRSNTIQYNTTHNLLPNEKLLVIQDVDPGSKVTARVQAVNSIGAGSFCSPVQHEIPPSIPGKIDTLNFHLKSGSKKRAGSINNSHVGSGRNKKNGGSLKEPVRSVVWKEPVDFGGCEIVGYEVNFEKVVFNKKSQFVKPPKNSFVNSERICFCVNTSWVAKGNQPLWVRVRALNKVGHGEFSEWLLIEARPEKEKAIEIPTPILTVDYDDAKQLNWTCAETTVNPTFLLEARGKGGQYKEIYRGSEKSFKLKPTQNDKTIQYRVRIVSKSGKSQFSTPVTIKHKGFVKVKNLQFNSTPAVVEKKKNVVLENVKNSKDTKSAGKKLAKVSKVIRWRNTPWYQRYPWLTALLALFVSLVVVKFMLFIYYA